MTIIRFILPLTLCLLLAACGGNRVKPEPQTPAATPAPTSTSASEPATPSTPPDTPTSTPATSPPVNPEKGSGGYYLDDGPAENPPVNIATIPDAVPRTEKLAPRANSPYSVFGKRYTPMQGYKPYKATGIASWYGKRFHGKKTSNGEIYDMHGMSGAHTTLPLPSYLRVTNPANGQSVVIRINDRGPFHSNRLVDLSYAAAHKLGLIQKGSGLVEIEAIDSRFSTAQNPDLEKETDLPGVITQVNAQESDIATPVVSAVASGSYVQVGAFKYENNAEALHQKLKASNLTGDGNGGEVALSNWYNNGIYRVRLGPYFSRAEAETAANKIKLVLGAKAIIINQD